MSNLNTGYRSVQNLKETYCLLSMQDQNFDAKCEKMLSPSKQDAPRLQKRKRGFPPKVNDDEIFNVLSELSIFDENGTLKTKKYKVWDEALSDSTLKNRIFKDNLYRKIQDNRNGLLDRLKEHFMTHQVANAQNQSSPEKSNYSSDSEQISDQDENPHRCKQIAFTVSLNNTEWNSIRPVPVLWGKNMHYKLQNDWVDVINKKTADSDYKIPCAYSFKWNRVYKKKTTHFFKFEGHCAECKTYILGECDREFSIDSPNVEIKIYTFDTKDIPHKKKRCLARTNRQEAQKILRVQSARAYKQDRVLKEMKFQDVEPHDLNSTAVYRQARQEIRNKDLGLEGPTETFESLEYFKKRGVGIHQIDDLAVSVIYFSDNQLKLYDEMLEESIKSKRRLVVIIDSTGGLIFPVEVEGIKSGYICLHQMITSIEGYKKPIPVTQMASERQDVNKIESWLNFTFDERIPPKEVVIDGSLTLANAVSLAFNGYNYKRLVFLTIIL